MEEELSAEEEYILVPAEIPPPEVLEGSGLLHPTKLPLTGVECLCTVTVYNYNCPYSHPEDMVK